MTKIIYREANGTDHIMDVKPGLSVMEGALENNLPGIDAECGGVCACATCQVYIGPDWFDRIPAISEEEKSMLEFAAHAQPNSRLSCQIRVDDSLEGLVVDLPASQR